MNRIISHTEFILRTTDCVALPGLGAFIVQNIPARYDSASHTFYPPFREIVFNPEIRHNDGILASSVARKENIGYEDACRIISSEIEVMKASLPNDGEYKFGNLGTFHSENGRLVFCPVEQSGVLPQINILPLSEREKPEVRRPDDSVRSTFFIRGLQIAATIIVLFILGIMLSTPISVEHSTVAYAKASLPTVSMPKKAVIVDSVAVELLIAIPFDLDSKADYNIPDENSSGKYGLVVASLATIGDAEKFISHHPDRSLQIYSSGSRIRIIAFSGDNPAELLRLANEPDFKKEFPEVWTCLK